MATSEISFGVLGPLQAHVGGTEIPVLANQQRIILACLVTAAGRPVGFNTLIERLWGSTPPAGARNAMQTYVGRLRRLLPEGTIHTGPGAYWIESGGIDLQEFLHLTALARNAQSEPETAVGLWRQAMALWRGAVLSNVESGPLHAVEGAWLTELLLAAAEQRFEAELHLENYADIAPELTALTVAYPFSERLRGQLMRALYGAGRPTEALTVYRETARMLRSELGVDPSAELRSLNQEILAGTHSAGVRAGLARRWQTTTSLPPVTKLIGRDAEYGYVAGLLKEEGTVPVVAVSGPSGVGKTALAVAVAHGLREHFPDGQLFAHMHHGVGPARDLAEVLAELLDATGADRVPDGLDARSAALRARLADRRVLMVVDDVVDAAQICPLIPGLPGSAVLVTSRHLLTGADSPTVVRLGPLAPEASLMLLAQAAGPERVADDPVAARAISAACGGLPLALRIAGARLARDPELRCADLAARLADRRRLLRELAVAGWSVRPGLELAYQGLDDAARTAFRRMALLCHAGVTAWALGAADAIGDATASVDALLEANLIQPAGRDAVGQARYRAHQLTSAYAIELAEADGETDNAVKRLLAALTGWAAEAFHRVRSPDDLPPSEDRLVAPLPRLTTGDVSEPVDSVAWLQAAHGLVTDAVMQGCGIGLYTESAALADYAVPVLSRMDCLDPARRVRLIVRDAAMAAGENLIAWRQRYGLCVLDANSGERGRVRDEFARCAEAFEMLGARDEQERALTWLAHGEAKSDLPTRRVIPKTAIRELSDEPEAHRSFRSHEPVLRRSRPRPTSDGLTMKENARC